MRVVAGDVVDDQAPGHDRIAVLEGRDDVAVLGPQTDRGVVPIGDMLRPGEHIPLDRLPQPRHGRRDHGIARGLGQRQMELGVQRQELRGCEARGIHRLQQPERLGKRLGGDVDLLMRTASFADEGSELPRGRRFEDHARAHDVGDGKALRRDLQADERRHTAHRSGDDDRTRTGTRAGRGADEAEHVEHAQRLTHARAPDAEGGGEFPLGREMITGFEGALEQIGLDLLQDDAPCTRGNGSVGHAMLLLWSDHHTPMWSDQPNARHPRRPPDSRR